MSVSLSGHVNPAHQADRANVGDGLANRPGQPYPTPSVSSGAPGLETGSPVPAGVVPWTTTRNCQWTAGESNPDYLGANQASSRWTSGPHLERSVRELNPVFLLTEEVCCRNTYRPFLRNSDPGWSRTIAFLVVTQASSPLDHGIVYFQ